MSINRPKKTPSIYETAANSIDTNSIHKTFQGTSPSLFYSAISPSVAEVDPTSDIYSDPSKRPLLSHQNSILKVKPTVWRTYDNRNSMMQVMDNVP